MKARRLPLKSHTGLITGTVAGLAFSLDGRTLASAGSDTTLRLWDVRTRKQLGAPLKHAGVVTGAAFSPDGRTLASVNHDGRCGCGTYAPTNRWAPP